MTEKAIELLKVSLTIGLSPSYRRGLITEALALLKNQPEPSEFTKKWRGNIEFWSSNEDTPIKKMWVDGIKEACDIIDRQAIEIEKLKEENRWIPVEDGPPDNIDWKKEVQVLECNSKIPGTMTMQEIFLDEGSDAEFWKPIILPDPALSQKAEDK